MSLRESVAVELFLAQGDGAISAFDVSDVTSIEEPPLRARTTLASEQPEMLGADKHQNDLHLWFRSFRAKLSHIAHHAQPGKSNPARV
jgi:hypothetical protein